MPSNHEALLVVFLSFSMAHVEMFLLSREHSQAMRFGWQQERGAA